MRPRGSLMLWSLGDYTRFLHHGTSGTQTHFAPFPWCWHGREPQLFPKVKWRSAEVFARPVHFLTCQVIVRPFGGGGDDKDWKRSVASMGKKADWWNEGSNCIHFFFLLCTEPRSLVKAARYLQTTTSLNVPHIRLHSGFRRGTHPTGQHEVGCDTRHSRC